MDERVDDWRGEGDGKWVRQADGGGVVQQQQLEEEDGIFLRRSTIYAACTHTHKHTQNTLSISSS